MHQTDDTLIKASGVTSDAVVINQCDREDYIEYKTAFGRARLFSTCQRGLTRSRNMAIREARADVCLLGDDDEIFVPEYEQLILQAYHSLSRADVIVFKMQNRPPSFPDRIQRLRFPKTMRVSSWQISFRRESILRAGLSFDEQLGAGSGNGAEEELKFLLDCQRAGLRIYYVPSVIASVAQSDSTWFHGFTETFFENRGATTRYILGRPLASLYALYYVWRKKALYSEDISPREALKATFRGIRQNRIGKQIAAEKKRSTDNENSLVHHTSV